MRIYAGLIFFGAAVLNLSARPASSLFLLVLEFIVAIALTIGAATRAAALLGVGIVVSRMLPVHGVATLVSPGPLTAFAMLLLTVALGSAGLLFGLDGLPGRRKIRSESLGMGGGGSVAQAAFARMPRWSLIPLRVYLGAAFL